MLLEPTITRIKLLFVICLTTLSACSPSTATVVPPTATVAPVGERFESEKFDYSFVYPPGWITKDKPGEWADFDPLDPNRGAGIDAFAAYIDGRTLALGIGARSLPDGTTLESWADSAKDLIQDGVSRGVCYEGIEDDPVSSEEIMLDGEPAILLEYVCPQSYDHFGLVVLSVHEGQGYWITWLSPQGEAARDRAEFSQILGTFSFVR